MIINSKFFHHPPYVSTSWKQVAAIHASEGMLILTLHNGDLIRIPNLSSNEMESVFKAHAEFLEKESNPSSSAPIPPTQRIVPQPLSPLAQALFSSTNPAQDSSFQFGIASADGFASALQHNQAQANMPDLPSDVLEKIGAIAKIIAPHESSDLPRAEPHCNCMYCQIARAINQGVSHEPPAATEEIETPVKDEELTFQTWNIQLKGDLMYQVTDKQDPSKSFTVFLGEPMGCTCGQEGCEHLIAVLKS